MAEGEECGFPVGPQPGVSYPLKMVYCGECTMPLEYCENGPCPEKCRLWLASHLPDMAANLTTKDDPESQDGAEKKRQKRGGKGGPKAPKAQAVASADRCITVQRAPRGKKSTTVVRGLATFDIDLKGAAKFFASRFACGSSVTGSDEGFSINYIVIQGDVKDDLLDIIPDKWKVDDDDIQDLGDQKR